MGEVVVLFAALALLAVPVAVFAVLWQLAAVRRSLQDALRRIESLEWSAAAARRAPRAPDVRPV